MAAQSGGRRRPPARRASLEEKTPMAKIPRPRPARPRAGLSRAGESERQDRDRHRRHAGARRGDRAAVRRARRGGARHLRPQRGATASGSRSEISATGCPTVFVKADLAKVADCRKVVGEGGRAVRPRRRARQRRGADRPRRYFRHHRGALQRDLRRQRARAVLPHSGDRADHAAARRSRARSSTSSRCRPMADSRSSPPIAPPRARSPP